MAKNTKYKKLSLSAKDVGRIVHDFIEIQLWIEEGNYKHAWDIAQAGIDFIMDELSVK